MTKRLNDNETELITETQQAMRELLGPAFDEPFLGMKPEEAVSQEGGGADDNAVPIAKVGELPPPNDENEAMPTSPPSTTAAPIAGESDDNVMVDHALQTERDLSPGTRPSILTDNRPLIVIDVETTGLRRDHDQIIECAIQMGLNGHQPPYTQRFKPTVPISAGAQEKHGISLNDLKGCPVFADHAECIRDIIEAAQIIVGYNVDFDLDMFQAEFQRAGQDPIDLSKKLIIDAYKIWQRSETRTLQDAYQRFVGGNYENEHNAEADVRATSQVLTGMLKSFKLTGKTSEDLHYICEPERAKWIGSSKHFQWDGDVPIFGFGKHQGVPITEIASGPDAGYLDWMTDNGFPDHVQAICRAAAQNDAIGLQDWIVNRFGPPPNISTDQPAV